MIPISYDKRFSKNHFWIEMDDDFTGRCGISEYLLEKLEHIVFVDPPEIGMEVRIDKEVGTIESQAMIRPIISPVSGRIVEINRELELAPDIINSDPMGAGWIYRIDVKEPNEFRELMDSVTYEEFLASEIGW